MKERGNEEEESPEKRKYLFKLEFPPFTYP